MQTPTNPPGEKMPDWPILSVETMLQSSRFVLAANTNEGVNRQEMDIHANCGKRPVQTTELPVEAIANPPGPPTSPWDDNCHRERRFCPGRALIEAVSRTTRGHEN
jgi:hypothetical protein